MRNNNKINEIKRTLSAYFETPEGQEHLKKIMSTLKEMQAELQERDKNR